MTTSSQAGKRRGKAGRAKRALGIDRKPAKTMLAEDPKVLMRQGRVVPRAEPSTRGAKLWTGGRRQARKVR